jgi:cell division protein FtsI/penicillin-binding protein 2
MERMTRFRSNVLLVLVAIVLCFFVGKLYTMQVVDAAEKADNITTYTTITRVRAARGDLLDTHGNVLVSNRASYNLEFNHYVVLNSDNPNESLRQLTQLCKTLDIAYEDHFPVTK